MAKVDPPPILLEALLADPVEAVAAASPPPTPESPPSVPPSPSTCLFAFPLLDFTPLQGVGRPPTIQQVVGGLAEYLFSPPAYPASSPNSSSRSRHPRLSPFASSSPLQPILECTELPPLEVFDENDNVASNRVERGLPSMGFLLQRGREAVGRLVGVVADNDDGARVGEEPRASSFSALPTFSLLSVGLRVRSLSDSMSFASSASTSASSLASDSSPPPSPVTRKHSAMMIERLESNKSVQMESHISFKDSKWGEDVFDSVRVDFEGVDLDVFQCINFFPRLQRIRDFITAVILCVVRAVMGTAHVLVRLVGSIFTFESPLGGGVEWGGGALVQTSTSRAVAKCSPRAMQSVPNRDDWFNAYKQLKVTNGEREQEDEGIASGRPK